jgi:hypothetical protein
VLRFLRGSGEYSLAAHPSLSIFGELYTQLPGGNRTAWTALVRGGVPCTLGGGMTG